MLWTKGWHETRFRLLFALGMTTLFLLSARSGGPTPVFSPQPLLAGAMIITAAMCTMLAGAGIVTQPAIQATKGIHGSILFTLSLPVSRLRLLLVRASLGWLEMAAGGALVCGGMWALVPELRAYAPLQALLEHLLLLIACSSAVYSISVLLATVFEDLYRIWGTMIVFGGLWWLRNHIALPATVDFVGAMLQHSPLLNRPMPWSTIAFCFVFAAALIYAASRIVQIREY